MTARIRAGLLRNRVQIQARTESVDGEGNVVSSWSSPAPAWARLEAQGMSEALEADRLEQDVTWLVTLRHGVPITHQSRILFGSRTLDVRTVLNVDESNRVTLVRCVERVIAG